MSACENKFVNRLLDLGSLVCGLLLLRISEPGRGGACVYRLGLGSFLSGLCAV